MQVTTQQSKSMVRAPVPASGKTSFKAAQAARSAAVFQIVWTVWAGGRRFYVVFHMVRPRTYPRVLPKDLCLVRTARRVVQKQVTALY